MIINNGAGTLKLYSMRKTTGKNTRCFYKIKKTKERYGWWTWQACPSEYNIANKQTEARKVPIIICNTGAKPWVQSKNITCGNRMSSWRRGKNEKADTGIVYR